MRKQKSEVGVYHGWSVVICARNSSVKNRCLVRAGLQTRARFAIRESLSGKPVRRVKLETVGRDFVRAGLQTRARFAIKESLSGKPVRRVKLETMGRDFVRAGLQTRARFTITECLLGEPVRRVKLETMGRVVNPGRWITGHGSGDPPAQNHPEWLTFVRSFWREDRRYPVDRGF